MSKQEELTFSTSGSIPASLILPILQRLEGQLSYIGSRVDEFTPRRHISESVKTRHRETVLALGGRCPCCGIQPVLDEDGCAINAEYDHFYSRERNALEDTWLICKSCHYGMKNRAQFLDQFKVYQQRVVAVEGGQLTLI